MKSNTRTFGIAAVLLTWNASAAVILVDDELAKVEATAATGGNCQPGAQDALSRQTATGLPFFTGQPTTASASLPGLYASASVAYTDASFYMRATQSGGTSLCGAGGGGDYTLTFHVAGNGASVTKTGDGFGLFVDLTSPDPATNPQAQFVSGDLMAGHHYKWTAGFAARGGILQPLTGSTVSLTFSNAVLRVPEPGTLALLVVGLLGALLPRRRTDRE